jgi:hypothetical protein
MRSITCAYVTFIGVYMMRKTNMQKAVRRQPSSSREGGRGPERVRDGKGDMRPGKQSKPAYKRKPLRIPTDAEQAELLQLAIEKQLAARGIKGAALRQELREWEHVLDKTHARNLHALNPFTGGRWAQILNNAVEEVSPDGEVWTVTIIDDDWMFSTYPSGPTEHDLRRMLSRMRCAVRPGLRGVSYLLQSDFAVRRHIVSNRLAIEVHWHGLVWATADQIATLQRRFQAGRFGADRLHAEVGYNLLGWLRYSTKDPRLGYNTVKNFGFQPGSRNWKEWFQHREPLSASKRWLLLAMIGDLTKPELCAASGVGLAVLRKARRMAKARGSGVHRFPAPARVVSRARRRR